MALFDSRVCDFGGNLIRSGGNKSRVCRKSISRVMADYTAYYVTRCKNNLLNMMLASRALIVRQDVLGVGGGDEHRAVRRRLAIVTVS